MYLSHASTHDFPSNRLTTQSRYLHGITLSLWIIVLYCWKVFIPSIKWFLCVLNICSFCLVVFGFVYILISFFFFLLFLNLKCWILVQVSIWVACMVTYVICTADTIVSYCNHCLIGCEMYKIIYKIVKLSSGSSNDLTLIWSPLNGTPSVAESI